MRLYRTLDALILMFADTQSFDAIPKRRARNGVDDIAGNMSFVDVQFHCIGDERRLSYGVKARRLVTPTSTAY